MFKNIKIALVALGCLSLAVTSCQKYDGDSYDFSNKEKDYITFSKISPVSVNNNLLKDSLDEVVLDSLGDPYPIYKPVDITVVTRMAFTEDITYTYIITLEGFEPQTRTGILKMGSTSSTITLDYPESVFPSGVTEAEGTVVLTQAKGEKYGELRIGYPKVGEKTKFDLDVLKPRLP